VLLGYLSFAAFVVPLGRLHFRWIQQGSFRLPCHDPDVVRPIPPLALRDIRWWSTALYLASPLFPRENQAFITTDASDSGWGFEVNSVCSRGVWDPHQLAWHINRKEMFAVSMAIQSNLPFLRNKTVLVQSDNSTVVAYLKHQGGTKSKRLLRDTIFLFQLAAAHNIHLNAQFIPSRYNTVADCLSRNRRLPDWHLSPQVTSQIFSAWGTPVIDLMATHASAVVPRYVSPGDGSHRGVHRRLLQTVALPARMDLPASGSGAASSPALELGNGDLHPDNASMGESVLEAGSESKSYSPSAPDRLRGAAVNRPCDQPAPREQCISSFGGLAGSGWLQQTAAWSDPDRLLLTRAWRRSTLRTYLAPWNR